MSRYREGNKGIEVTTIHCCRECSAPISRRKTWCAPCSKARDTARVRAYWKTPRGKATKARAQKRYYDRNTAALYQINKRFHQKLYRQGILIMGTRGPARYIAMHIAHIKAWRDHKRACVKQALLKAKLRNEAARASYPFIAAPTPGNADVLAVNALVPRGIAGREDVCQIVLLAILEGRTTMEAIKKRGALRAFTRRHIRESFELGGYAVSIDMPTKSGRSLHEVIAHV